MEIEWKQMLQDSGITEDLQLGRENVSGSKGKWSKIHLMTNLFQNFLIHPDFFSLFLLFLLLLFFDFLIIMFY